MSVLVVRNLNSIHLPKEMGFLQMEQILQERLRKIHSSVANRQLVRDRAAWHQVTVPLGEWQELQTTLHTHRPAEI